MATPRQPAGPDGIDQLIERAVAGTGGPVYLIAGDRVLAEPAGLRLASALAERAGCQVETHRRPPRLAPVLGDLRTFALFSSAKVVLAVETGIFADRSAAAAFLDDAAEALPLSGDDLSPAERRAAIRLLQAVRLFDVDPYRGDPGAVLGQLPDWAFQGAKGAGGRSRGRGKKQVETLRQDLAPLLAAARGAGLEGMGEDEVSELAAVLRDGLPEGHVLVLAESSVAADHPVVATLEERGAILRLTGVESSRDGWKGLDGLAAELARETGVAIGRDGLEELARRTLRQEAGFGKTGVASDSTARFAAEYRKLANLAQGLGRARIDAALVAEAVEDRGEEDVFKILDAVGAGRGAEAADRLRRYLASASDPIGARLSFFGLFAGFCRNLTAVSGMVRAVGVRPGERSYPRFKERLAPALQGDLDGRKSPLAGLHPYRLHRAYLAASGMAEAYLARLPWRVLQTELALKGESGDPEAALAELVAEVAAAPRRAQGPPGARPG